MKPRGYIQNHVRQRLRPPDNQELIELWILDNVLALEPSPQILPAQQIYGAYTSFGHLSNNKYLNAWNSARADLIADLVPIPILIPSDITLSMEPDGDTSLWLCRTVLRFTDDELLQLAIVDLANPRRALLPVLHDSCRVLKEPPGSSILINHYHRTRYLLIRYYIDAQYHDLKHYPSRRRI